MKKIFAISVLALAVIASCTPENKGPEKGANGKAKITVAEADLVAYLPMESATPEVGDFTLASEGSGNADNFKAGRTGKAYFGTVNSYLAYDLGENCPLKDLKAFTVSLWLKQAEIDYDHAPVPMYFNISDPTDACWGNLGMSVDRTDTGAGFLTYKWEFRMGDRGSVWKTWNDGYADCWPAGRWNHIIVTYDNVSSEFHAYCNGVDVTPEADVPCVVGDPAQPVGDLQFMNAAQLWIGNWPVRYYDGFQWGDAWIGHMDEAGLDEFRIYKRALTAEEAKALYDAEVANID